MCPADRFSASCTGPSTLVTPDDGAALSTGVVGMLTYHVELLELQPQPAAVVSAHVELAGLPQFLGGAFGEVMRILAEQHLFPTGPPFGRFRPTDQGFEATVGFPTTGRVRPVGRVTATTLPGGPTATVLHRGDYSAVAPAYDAATEWLIANGYEPAGEAWESYLDEPGVAEPRTVVHVPCRRVPTA
jgi:effector-binding domain-containing protein